MIDGLGCSGKKESEGRQGMEDHMSCSIQTLYSLPGITGNPQIFLSTEVT